MKNFDEVIDKFIASKDHNYYCTACSEGQLCCLDEEHKGQARKIIKQFISENYISKISNEEVEKKLAHIGVFGYKRGQEDLVEVMREVVEKADYNNVEDKLRKLIK